MSSNNTILSSANTKLLINAEPLENNTRISSVTTSHASQTVLATIQMPSNGLISVHGMINAANADYSAIIAGTYYVSVICTNGTASFVFDPVIISNFESLGSFDVVLHQNKIYVQVTGYDGITYNWVTSYTTLLS